MNKLIELYKIHRRRNIKEIELKRVYKAFKKKKQRTCWGFWCEILLILHCGVIDGYFGEVVFGIVCWAF